MIFINNLHMFDLDELTSLVDNIKTDPQVFKTSLINTGFMMGDKAVAV